jgi:hypothetical protein
MTAAAAIPAGLEHLQRWFLGAISGQKSGEPAAAHVTASDRLSAAERLLVYSRAYEARLVECMGECFPATKRALGDDLFDGFAAAYLEAHPPRSYTLARLGDRFARHLEETRPADVPSPGWPDLIADLARLEWAIDEVFDGPGVEGRPPLDLSRVACLGDDRFAEVRLRLAPCVRLLRFAFPIDGWYAALRRADATAPPPPPGPRDAWMLITRREYVVRRIEISSQQFDLLAALQGGATLGDAIARATGGSRLADAALACVLRGWFALWARMRIFEAVAGA